MVQEHGIHTVPQVGVFLEGIPQQRKVTHHMGVGQIFLHKSAGLKEFLGRIRIFIPACTQGQNHRIEQDIFGRKIQTAHQQAVHTFHQFRATLIGQGRALFILGPADHGKAVTANLFGLKEENVLPLFEADGLDDSLALHVFHARKQGIPPDGFYHHRTLGYGRLFQQVLQESRHLGIRVRKPSIQIHTHDSSRFPRRHNGNKLVFRG